MVVAILIITVVCYGKTSQKKTTVKPNWKKISGRWKISQNHLMETRGWSNIFGYSPLINRNSIVSLCEIEEYDETTAF